uniref:Uncharacterized protein n=1 Tax=Siphoviridae sp. ctAUQ2 TaxID=2826182 RepID=A0A8S5MZM9_9CAUD|nr:MAG TPA: hypothetical protein [Siphoviridae sp. ctAUQ2]
MVHIVSKFWKYQRIAIIMNLKFFPTLKFESDFL